jgi:hypothetical protein
VATETGTFQNGFDPLVFADQRRFELVSLCGQLRVSYSRGLSEKSSNHRHILNGEVDRKSRNEQSVGRWLTTHLHCHLTNLKEPDRQVVAVMCHEELIVFAGRGYRFCGAT